MTQSDPPTTPAGDAAKPNGLRHLPLFILAVIFTFVAIVFGGKACADKQEQELLAQGTAATATIVRLTDTGNRYNREPEYILTLVIEPEAGEPWQAEVTRVMSIVDAQTYQLGVVVDVKFDPADPSRVAIVGPAAAPAVPAADAPADAPPVPAP